MISQSNAVNFYFSVARRLKYRILKTGSSGIYLEREFAEHTFLDFKNNIRAA